LVNIDLSSLTTLQAPTSTTSSQAGPGSTGWGGGSLDCTAKTCEEKAPGISAAAQNNAVGLDPNLLMTILDGGEGCNKSKSSDGHGSCGYGQLLPENRRAYCGLTGTDEETCRSVQDNLQLDVDCAAKFIKESLANCFDGPIKEVDPPDKSTILDTKGSAGYIGGCYNCGPGKAGKCCGTHSYCIRTQEYFNSCQ